MLKKINKLAITFVCAAFMMIMEANTRAVAVSFVPKPLYHETASYTTNIPNRYGMVDETDIYYPILPQSSTETLPVALMLQGALVDKSDYSNYASIVSSYGFVVIVPNRRRFVAQFGEILAAETSQIKDVLKYLTKESKNAESPIYNILNIDKLVLLGHSVGGSVGLEAIGNISTRPDALVGGAFFGASFRGPSNKFISIKNGGIPIALLKGSLDGVTLAGSEQKTYDQIQDPPKALVTISGANHYGITNEDNPNRSQNIPTLEQDIATETIARWSALFLRATVLEDRDAKNYVFKTGDAQDPNVSVIIDKKSVPEFVSVVGTLTLAIFSVFGLSKKQKK